MKIFVALILFVGSNSWACPNISGNYTARTADEKILLNMSQQRCEEIQYTMTRTTNNNPPVVTKTVLLLDGKWHQVQSSPEKTLYMTGRFIKNDLFLKSRYYFKKPSHSLAVSYETISQQNYGDLLDKGVYTDASGPQKFEVIFENDHR